jgi:hypothetical protein
MRRVILLILVCLSAAALCTAAEIDLHGLIGSQLYEVYEAYGVPLEVFPTRGEKAEFDDVVFFYNDYLYIFWYENRVWQVRVDDRYQGVFNGISMGMTWYDVIETLGEPFYEEEDWVIYLLKDKGYPVRARLFFEQDLLTDAYIYRGDF